MVWIGEAITDNALVDPKIPVSGGDRTILHAYWRQEFSAADVAEVNDAFLLYTFPDPAWMMNSEYSVGISCSQLVDPDTGWNFDLYVGEDGDPNDITFILMNNSTVGTGVGAQIEWMTVITNKPVWLDVSGLKLWMLVNSAGEQAGSFDITVRYTQNLLPINNPDGGI